MTNRYPLLSSSSSSSSEPCIVERRASQTLARFSRGQSKVSGAFHQLLIHRRSTIGEFIEQAACQEVTDASSKRCLETFIPFFTWYSSNEERHYDDIFVIVEYVSQKSVPFRPGKFMPPSFLPSIFSSLGSSPCEPLAGSWRCATCWGSRSMKFILCKLRDIWPIKNERISFQCVSKTNHTSEQWWEL